MTKNELLSIANKAGFKCVVDDGEIVLETAFKNERFSFPLNEDGSIRQCGVKTTEVEIDYALSMFIKMLLSLIGK